MSPAANANGCPSCESFYGPFSERIDTAQAIIPRVSNIDEETDEICPECGTNMVIKRGRYGPFLSCSRFPDCRGMKRIQKSTGAHCPECGGELVQRASRKSRRSFYGCSNYPTCNFVSNQEPLPQPCPDCAGLVLASGRTNAACHNKECGWQGTREELGAEQPERELVEV